MQAVDAWVQQAHSEKLSLLLVGLFVISVGVGIMLGKR